MMAEVHDPLPAVRAVLARFSPIVAATMSGCSKTERGADVRTDREG